MTEPRHPYAEAVRLVGEEFDPRVLEPSPPYAADDAYRADDPVAAGTPCGRLVLPTGMAGGDLSWDDWLVSHPEQADWVRTRWLGGERRLPSLPADLSTTRVSLHRLAVYVIAPVRYAATGKWGLRYTHGGFGTPFFGQDRQVRVEGTMLVDQRGRDVRTVAITTLRAAAEFLESAVDPDLAGEDDSPAVGDVDEALALDAAAASFLGEWYGMAHAGLEIVRADPGSIDPTRPQLWPGHFDPAIEIGDDRTRGSYGASPGDPAIPEPYLYAALWNPDRLDLDADDGFWNAPSFTGAILRVSEFPAAADAAIVAADFWRRVRDALG